MAILTEHENWYQIDNTNYWKGLDTQISTDFKYVFDSLEYLLKTVEFDKNIFIQLQNVIYEKPELIAQLLDSGRYLDLITMLSTDKDCPLQKYISDVPAKLELIKHTFENRHILDSDDRIAVENVIVNVNSLDLLLKAEWPNLTLEEQLWPIYAHLLNFNNIFDEHGDTHFGRAASLYVMNLPSPLTHDTLRYDEYIPCMRSKYGDVMPEAFFNRLDTMYNIMGDLHHVNFEMLLHLYKEVLNPSIIEDSIDFDLVS